MSQRQMVLSAVGPDAFGRVKHVSSFLLRAGCNLEDSRMARLAGEFAIIVLFSGSDEALGKVEAGRELLAAELGFVVTLKEATPAQPGPSVLGYDLRVGGVDQPGIVFAVSEALAAEQINVVSFDSRLERAAFSGTPVFVLQARLHIPGRPALGRLRGALEGICDERNLSYTLEPADLP